MPEKVLVSTEKINCGIYDYVDATGMFFSDGSVDVLCGQNCSDCLYRRGAGGVVVSDVTPVKEEKVEDAPVVKSVEQEMIDFLDMEDVKEKQRERIRAATLKLREKRRMLEAELNR